MPANKGQTPNWHPKPDFQAAWYPQTVAESPKIDFDDESQVAAWLVDTPEYEVYAFMPGIRVEDLALDAARAMVAERHMRQVPAESRAEECVRRPLRAERTIAVICRKDIDTGKPLPSLGAAVGKTRSFG